MLKTFSAILCIIIGAAGNQQDTAEALADKGGDLPATNSSGFIHYSGYLNTSDGHSLHYWLIESESLPATDPLIFWFNGGPGCSSLTGALWEMGPWLIDEKHGALYSNPNAWTKFANVVYMESPFGVGFSTLTGTGDSLYQGDSSTAKANNAAISEFFKRFPRFLDNPMFIAGESYAGIYLPTLGVQLIENQPSLNFRGVLIGNGLLSETLSITTLLEFAYGHGLIDEPTWQRILDCCGGRIQTCLEEHGFSEERVQQCGHFLMDEINRLWEMRRVNPYDIYSECRGKDGNGTRFAQKWSRFVSRKVEGSGLSGLRMPPFHYHNKGPCMDSQGLTAYVNSDAVRKALNIPPSSVDWQMCNDDLFDTYEQEEFEMQPFVQRILGARVPILLFYGNTDMACNFLMAQQFAANLSLTVTSKQQPWLHNGEFAGVRTIYANGLLTYATVNGAGHMAAASKPAETRQLVQEFIGSALVYEKGSRLLIPH